MGEANKNMRLYEMISLLCKERGVAGSKMCTDIGHSKSLMTDLRTKPQKGINVTTATKIADYFGVSLDYLLCLTPDAQMDLKKYKINELRKLLENSPDEERPAIESDIGALQESLQELQPSADSDSSSEQAQKNNHPAEAGRVVDKRTQRIFDFVDECSPEEFADLAKYIDFLEARRATK